MIKTIHPFPARMASDLAIDQLKNLNACSVVLDQMVGSGTVPRHAIELGHTAIGFDKDPLAVLMSSVWTTPVTTHEIDYAATNLFRIINSVPLDSIILSWIDEDEETTRFVDFWFAEHQRNELRRIACALKLLQEEKNSVHTNVSINVLKLALTRIIITKEKGASLARDTSHSRPHRVATESEFDVINAFKKSILALTKLLDVAHFAGCSTISFGDARSLPIEDNSIDAIITSPPYLNAIDYLRGHRLGLVWLGYRISDLRNIRSNNIGAERAPDVLANNEIFDNIAAAMGDVAELPSRYRAMVNRYSQDVYNFMSESARVLKPGGEAIMVIGNSCLKGKFIRNSDAIIQASLTLNLSLIKEIERELPNHSRYLPMPAKNESALGMRMRTETVLTFLKC